MRDAILALCVRSANDVAVVVAEAISGSKIRLRSGDDRVEEVRAGAADREVDHVDTVSDGLVDRRHAVGAGAAALFPFQQTLYAAIRARGAMPLILPSGAAAPVA